MAIKRKDIRAILDDEALDGEGRTKKLLDLIHAEIDEIRDGSDGVTAELEKAKADLANAIKDKDAAVKALEDFKTETTSKETRSKKELAYKALLKEAGIADKRISSVAKLADYDKLELDKDGKLKNADAIKNSVKEEWADFISAQQTPPAGVDTPPAGSNGGMTIADIKKIKDPGERQKAIAENHELFGF